MSTGDIPTPMSPLIKRPNCNSMVRGDRLQNHIKKFHTSPTNCSSTGLIIKLENNDKDSSKLSNGAYINKVFYSPKNKKGLKKLTELQNQEALKSNPSAKFGEAIGSILKIEKSNEAITKYEQAACSCNGENERCFKCNGTGFYIKKIIEELSIPTSKTTKSSRSAKKTRSIQESSFSNDPRGNDYGIRENGRFSSNPLYDDHD